MNNSISSTIIAPNRRPYMISNGKLYGPPFADGRRVSYGSPINEQLIPWKREESTRTPKVETPPLKVEKSFLARLAATVLDFLNTSASTVRNQVASILTPIFNQNGLSQSPVISNIGTAANIASLTTMSIEALGLVFNVITLFRFKKDNKPDQKLPKNVGERFYKHRLLVIGSRVGLSAFNVFRMSLDGVKSILLFAGTSSTALGITILGIGNAVGMIIWGALFVIRNSYVLAKTKKFLNKIKDYKAPQTVFFNKLKDVQQSILKSKIHSRKLRIILGVVVVGLGAAALAFSIATASAASFGALPAALLLPLIVYFLVDALYGMISGHQAKKQLQQDQFKAGQKLDKLTKKAQELTAKIERRNQRLSRLDRKIMTAEARQDSLSLAQYKGTKVRLAGEKFTFHQQLETIRKKRKEINDDIDLKTWKVYPEKALGEVLNKITTKNISEEEKNYLEYCYAAKKKKEPFEDFIKELRYYGRSQDDRKQKIGINILKALLFS